MFYKRELKRVLKETQNLLKRVPDTSQSYAILLQTEAQILMKLIDMDE